MGDEEVRGIGEIRKGEIAGRWAKRGRERIKDRRGLSGGGRVDGIFIYLFLSHDN